MLARAIGVEVDHLGLEPQAELHAQAVHMLGERIESIGPHLGVDNPVACALRVVAAQVEPAVVEHEALHAHLRGQIGERDERGLVVVEIHRLPCIERHRPVAAHGFGSERSQRWKRAAMPSRPWSDHEKHTSGAV